MHTECPQCLHKQEVADIQKEFFVIKCSSCQEYILITAVGIFKLDKEIIDAEDNKSKQQHIGDIISTQLIAHGIKNIGQSNVIERIKQAKTIEDLIG